MIGQVQLQLGGAAGGAGDQPPALAAGQHILHLAVPGVTNIQTLMQFSFIASPWYLILLTENAISSK